jgi:hypothetical protein
MKSKSGQVTLSGSAKNSFISEDLMMVSQMLHIKRAKGLEIVNIADGALLALSSPG